MKENSSSLNSASYRRHEGGWSLVGTLIGGAVVSALAIGGSVIYNNYQEDLVAQGRAKQIGSGLDQLDAYARKYQTALTSGSGVAGVANPLAPTIAELKALGFAAGSFDDSAQPGGKLLFEIKKEPSGCAAAKCVLHLTAVTSSSVKSAGEVNQQLAGLIAGYVPNGAGWTNAINDPLNLVKKGIMLPNPRGNMPAVVAAKAWLGNSQASQTVPPPSYSYRNASCSGGQIGHREQERVTTTDKWGNTSTGSWYTIGDYCEDPPPPPAPDPEPTPTPSRPADAICWEDQWPNIYQCPAGTTGSHYSTTYRTCPGGPYAPDYTFEGPHTIDCHAPGASTPAPTPEPTPVPTPAPTPITPGGDPKDSAPLPETPDKPVQQEDPVLCSVEIVERSWTCNRGSGQTRIMADHYNVCYKGATQVSSTQTGGSLLIGMAYCDRITGELTDFEYY